MIPDVMSGGASVEETLALWAQVRNQGQLSTQAQWMLAAEADAARTLWLEPDLDFADGYAHDIVSLTWGGKRAQIRDFDELVEQLSSSLDGAGESFHSN